MLNIQGSNIIKLQLKSTLKVMKKWKILNDSDKQSNSSKVSQQKKSQYISQSQLQPLQSQSHQKIYHKPYQPLKRTKMQPSNPNNSSLSNNGNFNSSNNAINLSTNSVKNIASKELYLPNFVQKYIRQPQKTNRSNRSDRSKMRTEIQGQFDSTNIHIQLGIHSLQDIQQNKHNTTQQHGPRTSTNRQSEQYKPSLIQKRDEFAYSNLTDRAASAILKRSNQKAFYHYSQRQTEREFYNEGKLPINSPRREFLPDGVIVHNGQQSNSNTNSNGNTNNNSLTNDTCHTTKNREPKTHDQQTDHLQQLYMHPDNLPEHLQSTPPFRKKNSPGSSCLSKNFSQNLQGMQAQISHLKSEYNQLKKHLTRQQKIHEQQIKIQKLNWNLKLSNFIEQQEKKENHYKQYAAKCKDVLKHSQRKNEQFIANVIEIYENEYVSKMKALDEQKQAFLRRLMKFGNY